jgi:hypothetical protein
MADSYFHTVSLFLFKYLLGKLSRDSCSNQAVNVQFREMVQIKRESGSIQSVIGSNERESGSIQSVIGSNKRESGSI